VFVAHAAREVSIAKASDAPSVRSSGRDVVRLTARFACEGFISFLLLSREGLDADPPAVFAARASPWDRRLPGDASAER
jgi:hypothetical protein